VKKKATRWCAQRPARIFGGEHLPGANSFVNF
jgi:hypothetical protein